MSIVYLDNSATTQVCREAAEKVVYMMTECFGNPSSLHTLGFHAEQEMMAAREVVASLMGAKPETVTFTSGGTESNNLAILGGAAARCRQGRHAVTTAVEHPSVAKAFDQLEKDGWTVTRLVPDEQGCISPRQVADACTQQTMLVSIMTVNNETGAHFPIEKMVPLVRKKAPDALIHTDAVQAAGKLRLQAERWGVDLMSVSSHKIHGPKGCGALYIRKGVHLHPRALGGGQEKDIRSGTEPLPAICGFGAAAKMVPDYDRQSEQFTALKNQLVAALADVPGVVFHLPENGVPYIINFSVVGIRSETMLHFLSQRDIYISSGSACSKGRKSPVLMALHFPDAEIDSALRISLSRQNTAQDIQKLTDAIKEAKEQLASVR